jgi:hypothetical protein
MVCFFNGRFLQPTLPHLAATLKNLTCSDPTLKNVFFRVNNGDVSLHDGEEKNKTTEDEAGNDSINGKMPVL